MNIVVAEMENELLPVRLDDLKRFGVADGELVITTESAFVAVHEIVVEPPPAGKLPGFALPFAVGAGNCVNAVSTCRRMT